MYWISLFKYSSSKQPFKGVEIPIVVLKDGDFKAEGVKTLPVQSDISADMSISPSFVLACCCPAMLITFLKAGSTSHLVQCQKAFSAKTEADFFFFFFLPVCLLCLSEVFSSASSVLCVITTLKEQEKDNLGCAALKTIRFSAQGFAHMPRSEAGHQSMSLDRRRCAGKFPRLFLSATAIFTHTWISSVP